MTTSSVSDSGVGESELYRREAIGAFAHEIRTPLTSIRMVLELARRQSNDGELVLDQELAEMLLQSVTDLQQLADDLQETSRFERGRLSFAAGTFGLPTAVAAARDLLGERLRLVADPIESLMGPWDGPRLVRSIAGFAEATNRMGEGTGAVHLSFRPHPAGVELVFESGRPGGAPKPVASDAGFAFFHARQFVLASGGSVECDRCERYVRITVWLPLESEVRP